MLVERIMRVALAVTGDLCRREAWEDVIASRVAKLFDEMFWYCAVCPDHVKVTYRTDTMD